MNVTLENLAPCKKLLRVEVETPKVDETFESVTKDFQKQASLPGFRPGKAPREMVVKKYGKDIEDEVKRKLVSEAYKKAVEEKKLDVLGYPDIEEIQFNRGEPLQFAATVETAPEFELPEYKGIPIKREARSVTDEDVTSALEKLREARISFKTVEREAKTGDVVVVNYTGSCEGKSIREIAPAAQGLTEKQNFWINIPSPDFIPGFGEQLIGAKAGEKRTVSVDFPEDFVTPQLAGKKGSYDVEVLEVKEKEMPSLDDALATSFGAENLEKLKEGVRHDLQHELERKQDEHARGEIIRSLLNRVNFDLPETSVANETRNVVYDIVRQNSRRGVPGEVIQQQRQQIESAAAQGARERVKVAFLLQKIAEKEDIKVSQAEIAQRVAALAAMYQIPPEKFAKDLQKRNGLIEVYDQIMNEKALEFLKQNASIEETAPGATPAAPQP